MSILDVDPLLFFGVVSYCLVSALFCARLAKVKGYNMVTWFVGGLLFNVLALLAIAGLPTREQKPN